MDDPSSETIVAEYLTEHEPVFQTLASLRQKVTDCCERTELEEMATDPVYKGWDNPNVEEKFKKRRHRVDYADQKSLDPYFDRMCEIGDEMESLTNVFSPSHLSHQKINVLDLGMAPGGFSASAMKHKPGSTVRGVTLSIDQGGYPLSVTALPGCQMDVEYLDITMLAEEFGVTKIPPNHPEGDKFSTARLFANETFDLVFCDGKVLRNHPRPEHREPLEPTRFILAQLILAMQRIKPGGSLVVSLHKADSWSSMQLIRQIDRFASVQLFNAPTAQRVSSSFHLIAKEVRPESDTAKEAVKKWKEVWWRATFGGEKGTGEAESSEPEFVEGFLDEFGERLINLALPVWQLQVEVLRKEFG